MNSHQITMKFQQDLRIFARSNKIETLCVLGHSGIESNEKAKEIVRERVVDQLRGSESLFEISE